MQTHTSTKSVGSRQCINQPIHNPLFCKVIFLDFRFPLVSQFSLYIVYLLFAVFFHIFFVSLQFAAFFSRYCFPCHIHIPTPIYVCSATYYLFVCECASHQRQYLFLIMNLNRKHILLHSYCWSLGSTAKINNANVKKNE